MKPPGLAGNFTDDGTGRSHALRLLFLTRPAAAIRQVVAAVKANGGDMKATAKALGISRRTVYHYVAEHEDIAAAVAAARAKSAAKKV